MADELKNAVDLMQDLDLRGMIMAATVYEATQIVVEDPATANHATRLELADRIIRDPNYAVEFFHRIISCDPEVATLGNDYTVVPEVMILNKVSVIWTKLSYLLVGSQEPVAP